MKRWVYSLSCVIIYVLSIFISSPFLFVIGDDHVIRYTRPDIDTGDVEDDQTTE